MSTVKRNKINQLLQSQPNGVVFLASWLKHQGYSFDLQKRYRNSKWLQSIGSGAMIRTGDKVTYLGALYALQNQKKSSIHPAGKTALALLGKSHYLELSPKRVTLFGGKQDNLPTWFKKYKWGVDINYFQSLFLPGSVGLTEIEINQLSLKASNSARAIMECLYLVPKYQDMTECYKLMEGLNNLRPSTVQKLLEACTSIKVKRLFLYLAERSNHLWFEHLDVDRIELGSGKRSVIKGGKYIPKYKITVDNEIA